MTCDVSSAATTTISSPANWRSLLNSVCSRHSAFLLFHTLPRHSSVSEGFAFDLSFVWNAPLPFFHVAYFITSLRSLLKCHILSNVFLSCYIKYHDNLLPSQLIWSWLHEFRGNIWIEDTNLRGVILWMIICKIDWDSWDSGCI